MSEISDLHKQIFYTLDYTRETLRSIDDSLKKINGRLRKNEIDIARIKMVGLIAMVIVGILSSIVIPLLT